MIGGPLSRNPALARVSAKSAGQQGGKTGNEHWPGDCKHGLDLVRSRIAPGSAPLMRFGVGASRRQCGLEDVGLPR